MESKTKTKNPFQKILIIIGLIAFFVYAVNFVKHRPNLTEIKIGTSAIFAQTADTEHERSMGLSYAEKIDDNSGMLFVFDETGPKNFWMRDMLFDIDIIWLDENKQVVGFFERVSKNSYNREHPELSRIYHSPDNTKYVLEVNAGIIEKLKIKTGDTFDFKY
jgi:uncharacterized membrane protein (UPF0127 family)